MFKKILAKVFEKEIADLAYEKMPCFVTALDNRNGVLIAIANKVLPLGSPIVIYELDPKPLLSDDSTEFLGHLLKIHACGWVSEIDPECSYIKIDRLNSEVKIGDLVKINQ